MNFYHIFLDLCNSINKSPSKVALEIGTTKPAVTRWKSGSIPSDATLLKIANYFNVSTDYLLGKTEIKNPPTSDTEAWTVYNFEGNGTRTTTINQNNINALKKLLNAAGDLTPEQIEALIKVAETMK